MDKRGLLRLALAVLARQVHRQGQEPRAQEAGYTSGYQVNETEPWREERWSVRKGPLWRRRPSDCRPGNRRGIKRFQGVEKGKSFGARTKERG